MSIQDQTMRMPSDQGKWMAGTRLGSHSQQGKSSIWHPKAAQDREFSRALVLHAIPACQP